MRATCTSLVLMLMCCSPIDSTAPASSDAGGESRDAGPSPDSGVDGGALEVFDAGPPFAYDFASDLQYSSTCTLCKLNIAVPRGLSSMPAVVFIHGGGWAPTGREKYNDEIKAYASAGYVALTIDYQGRSSGWRAILKSVKTAVRWLRANAAAYHIDPNRVAVVGASAGGQLASMLGTTADDAEFAPSEFLAVSDRVQGVVSFSGSYDLERNWAETADPAYVRPILELVFGGAEGNTPQLVASEYAAGSPLNHVSADDAPFCLCHGTADTTSPVSQVAPMAAALATAGVSVETLILTDAPHIWDGTPYATAGRAKRDECVARFLHHQ